MIAFPIPLFYSPNIMNLSVFCFFLCLKTLKKNSKTKQNSWEILLHKALIWEWWNCSVIFFSLQKEKRITDLHNYPPIFFRISISMILYFCKKKFESNFQYLIDNFDDKTEIIDHRLVSINFINYKIQILELDCDLFCKN